MYQNGHAYHGLGSAAYSQMVFDPQTSILDKVPTPVWIGLGALIVGGGAWWLFLRRKP